jgi:hypothetical protein
MTTAATLTIGIAPAPAAQGKGDRVAQPRAPKGGIVDASGRHFKGGQFLPLTFVGNPISATPAPLVGSYRQIPWAEKIRRVELAGIAADVVTLRGRLETAGRKESATIRGQIREMETRAWKLKAERSAAAIIGWKMGRAA